MKNVKDILWAERTREEFSDWAKRGAVVIVPICSTEQHGLHLPVNTDCQTAEYVAQQAACLAEGVLILPAGIHGNVLRVLAPLVISDEGLGLGLDVIDAAVMAATPTQESHA